MPGRDAGAHSGDEPEFYADAQRGHASSVAGDGVEQHLVHYGFVREEHEREVRLFFRDAPSGSIARAFRMSGASLISLSGERAQPGKPDAGVEPDQDGETRTRRRHGQHGSAVPTGEATLRYFFARDEIVYTVTIVSGSGVTQSIADVYPVAALSERELRDQLGIVFTGWEEH